VSQPLAYRCQGGRAGFRCSNRAKYHVPAGARCGHCRRADEAKAREAAEIDFARAELTLELEAISDALARAGFHTWKLRRLLRGAARA
jgi:hypothetical protein